MGRLLLLAQLGSTYFHYSMQRPLAKIVLATFLWSALAPLALSQVPGSSHACCHRHHASTTHEAVLIASTCAHHCCISVVVKPVGQATDLLAQTVEFQTVGVSTVLQPSASAIQDFKSTPGRSPPAFLHI